MSKARSREAFEGYLFLLPNFLGFLIFMAVPLALFTTPSPITICSTLPMSSAWRIIQRQLGYHLTRKLTALPLTKAKPGWMPWANISSQTTQLFIYL
jgi:hypothetical protein